MLNGSKNGKRARSGAANWILKYTLLYLPAALAMALYFIGSGNSMVFSGDGYYQHYTILAHIRNAIQSLARGEGFAMVSYQIGQGMDTLTTLASHGFLNPLYWIAALFSKAGLETAYAVLTFVQFYLMGLLPGAFLRQFRPFRESRGWAAPVAGLVFAFCGYNLISVLRHPYFAEGSIYLALMLIGVERLLQKKKWCMLTVVTAVMLISNYYFAYKTALLSAIYILIRILPHLHRTHGGVRRVLREGFSLLGACLLGVLLSAVVLIPVGIAFLGSSRSAAYGGYSGSLLHYGLMHYAKMLLTFCAPGIGVDCWTILGFCPVVLIALADLLASRREYAALEDHRGLHRGVCAALLIGGLFLCVPMCGKIFNGMSYVTNRWGYGFAFAVCTATALWFLRMEGERRALPRGAGVLMLVYAVGVAASAVIGGARMLAGAVCVGLFGALCLLFGGKIRLKTETATRICALAVALCCAVYAFVGTAAQDGYYPQDVLAQVQSSPAGQAELPEEGFYRLDTGLNTDNHGVLLDYNGTGFYWSVVPAHVSEYYQNLQVGTLSFSYRLNSVGGDSTLLALSGAKYSVRDAGEGDMVLPYGAEAVSKDENAALYRNPYALELGYVYHAQLSESEYAALNPVEKRVALLSSAVLPDDAQPTLPEYRNDLEIEEIKWSNTNTGEGILTDTSLSGGAGERVTLQFERPDDAEIYIAFDACEAVSAPGQVGHLEAYTSNGNNTMAFTQKSSNFYYVQQGVCASLGSGAAQTDTVELCLMEDEEICFSGLHMYSLPMQAYRDRIQALQKEDMTDVQIGRNCVSGRVTLETEGMLQIAIPYSTGWTVQVDGEEAELQRCGGMYMGVALGEGAHQLELSYCTPGLKAGAAVSLAALAILAALLAFQTAKKREKAASRSING